MRRVLVLSAHYPPVSGSQSIRVAKLLKHLPSHGWQPDVVCVSEDPVFGRDETLLADVPAEARILRVPVSHSSSSRVIARFQVPDYLSAWVPAACRAALALQRRDSYDALLSLSFPASSHVAALFVRAASSIPWLADFSDPWMNNPYALGPSGPRRFVGAALEREVVRSTQRLGFATPELRDYVARYRPEAAGKSVILPNASEVSDFSRVKPRAREGDGFTFLHVGNLYGTRQPDHFLEGLARFRERHPEANARVRFVGTWKGSQQEGVVADARLKDAVEIVPPVPRKEALSEMLGADVLVVIDPNPRTPGIFLPMKLVEYLMAGRPILALTVFGPVSQTVAASRMGISVPFDDAIAISSAMSTLWRATTGVLGPDFRVVTEFEASNVGQRLAVILDAIARPPAAR